MRLGRLPGVLAVGCAVVFSAVPSALPTTAETSSVRRMPSAIPATAGHLTRLDASAPMSTRQCRTRMQQDCYGPRQYQIAYDLRRLYRRGIDGAGRTIVIIDSYGSPTVQHDLNVFDTQYDLPSTTVEVHKWGRVPGFNPRNEDMDGWAGETALDVEYAHAIAPAAHIELIETGTSEQEGTSGFPQMMDAMAHLHGQGDVVSLSLGATEDTFAQQAHRAGDYRLLTGLRYGLEAAAAQHTTVVAAAGDNGATDDELNGKTLFRRPEVGWPASDPLVTGVGGTRLYLNDNGRRTVPDRVWNDGDAGGAAGGGVSRVFGRPAFQHAVAGTTGGHRGVPDVSMSASPDGGAWVYESYDPAHSGWDITGGTSQATPMFAGVVALADQAAGTRVGDLNPALYRLAPGGRTHGVVDVTAGANGANGVRGYRAAPGYDLASGCGTIDGYRFVTTLAATLHTTH
ncbi:S53 family peptidase [Streptomyces sp. ICBB 8177]|uniref:S53 family peptidase n=1 Tax=Streptomyces sp. ICBB 8177 TaxID=563922 RepID=UPI000D6814D3|nr:S53 family peptidase [Streptomyces sp. ICBB 8177]PWI44732.1 protease [Streptomyces sp. ICBB 8177]